MNIFALLVKGLGDDEDSWDIISCHKTRKGANKALKKHADEFYNKDEYSSKKDYKEENYEVNEHAVQE